MTFRDRFFLWQVERQYRRRQARLRRAPWQQRLRPWVIFTLVFFVATAIFAGCWAISDTASGCPAGMHQDVAGVELGGEYYGCVEDR
jgi:hypothetical protein